MHCAVIALNEAEERNQINRFKSDGGTKTNKNCRIQQLRRQPKANYDLDMFGKQNFLLSEGTYSSMICIALNSKP